MKNEKFWTAVVLTCQTKDAAQAFQEELNIRQQKGLIPKDVLLLTVEDPKSQVGSGGATLNALLVVTEHISAQNGFTVVNADILKNTNILIFHMGRNFPFDPCGRAFVTFPIEMKGLDTMANVCNIDILYHAITTKLSLTAPPGVWVCSTDMVLHIPSDADFDLSNTDVCAISVPSSVEYSRNHGVFKVDSQNNIENIIYGGTDADLRGCFLPDSRVPLAVGVIYFSHKVSDQLLSLHVIPPLDACTYMGLDSGAQPVQISLYFDLLLPMCSGLTEDMYVNHNNVYGNHGHQALQQSPASLETSVLQQARRQLWKMLHQFQAKIGLIEGGSCSYMDLSGEVHSSHLMSTVDTLAGDEFILKQNHMSFVEPGEGTQAKTTGSRITNSRICQSARVENCCVSHSYISQPIKFGRNCVINGVWTIGSIPRHITDGFRDNLIMQTFHIKLSTLRDKQHYPVLTVVGRSDDLMKPVKSGGATFCNEPFDNFMRRTGITFDDLWDAHLSEKSKCLINAKLFPVCHATEPVGWEEIYWLQYGSNSQGGGDNFSPIYSRWRSSWRLSLEEIISLTDVYTEFKWRRRIQYEFIAGKIIEDTLLQKRNVGLNPLYKAAVVDGYSGSILETLNKVANNCNDKGVIARIMANIADVLGAMSRGQGGLRSGPAANEQWKHAFGCLERGDIKTGIRELATVCKSWQDRPDLLVRAARHYEGAAQIIIRHAVMTAREFIRHHPADIPEMGKCISAECAARIDIAGGWSDTPPITYEHGGAVINAAITIDDKKPIGAKVKRIPKCELIFRMGGSNKDIVITQLDQLRDFSSPHAPGALLKAAFVCAEVVEFPSETSLHDQLSSKYRGGFELSTYSNLPHGSGLGTSSILAGVIMAVIWRAAGVKVDVDSLNHAVLHLEQMLTTGGGWQDQVGGLTSSIKVGHSLAELPLRVEMTFPEIRTQTVQGFSDRLVLVYTGKTRLARNLLQNVLRNWYARNPDIVKTEDDLVDNAWKCSEAFQKGDLSLVGECMNVYWEQKKKMAPGCEPEAVTHMMAALRPHVYGISMAGAGGGGFMYVLTKEPHQGDNVRQILSEVKGAENISVHESSVETSGLVLDIEDVGQEVVPIKI